MVNSEIDRAATSEIGPRDAAKQIKPITKKHTKANKRKEKANMIRCGKQTRQFKLTNKQFVQTNKQIVQTNKKI